MQWTGKRWAQEDTLLTYDLVRKECRIAAALAEKQSEPQNTISDLSKAKTRSAVETLARSDRRFAATAEQWDADNWLINTPDGIVDLRIGKNIGSDPISPLFEKALTYYVAPAMASTTEALAAFVRWDLFRNSMLRFMENYDAVLSPVASYPAVLHGTSFDEPYRKGLGYAQMYNLTGWPSATVRIGTSPEGLPLNVQVAARPWREDVALALALHLEKSFGGWKMPMAV